MEKKYKMLIVISIVLIITIFVGAILLKKNSFVLVLSHETVLEYDEHEDSFIPRLVQNLNKDNLYHIRLDDGTERKSKLFYKDIWQYEKNGAIIDIDTLFFAATENKKHSVISFQTEELTEDDIIEVDSIIRAKGVLKRGEFGYAEKVIIDLDNDGIKEEIISASNVFSSSERDKDFSLVYIRKQGHNYILLDKVEAVDDFKNTCVSYISGIIDLNNDKNYEVVVGCNYFDQMGVKYLISRLSQNSVKNIKEF